MSKMGSIDENLVSRRTVLSAVTTVGFSMKSGCSASSKRQDEEVYSSGSDREYSEELREIKSNIESIYREINRNPIAENGEFVFDIQKFENGFDHKSLLEEIRAMQDRIDAITRESISQEERETLSSMVRLAELLIRERFFTHQFIAAGLTFEQRLIRDEYAKATEAIQHGKEFLEKLSVNGREIEDELETGHSEAESIEEFDPDPIKNSQSVLVEIVQWTTIVFQGFHHATLGFELFEEGVDSIKEERIGEVSQIYENATEQFNRAIELLEEAQGRGTRLDYVIPLVRNLRCVLPVYRDTGDRFADSFRAWQSGEEEEAREIARKTINEIDRQMIRCEDLGPK